jgi:DNA replicative helicase MCM subunit Mcm2 (Cdc46/Mcm family)
MLEFIGHTEVGLDLGGAPYQTEATVYRCPKCTQVVVLPDCEEDDPKFCPFCGDSSSREQTALLELATKLQDVNYQVYYEKLPGGGMRKLRPSEVVEMLT